MTAKPLWIPSSGQRLFGVLHEAAPSARAGIIMCAPILHEYVRSHRLFALLAHELSRLQFNVLRFDYQGTGDSEGEDEGFSMQQAAQDAEAAVEVLRSMSAGLPVIALGIRAGVFTAARLLRHGKVDRLWMWQPVIDGARYVDELRERDALERKSSMRYSVARTENVGDSSTLMGYPAGRDLIDQLRGELWSDTGIDATAVTLLDAGTSPGSPAHARFVELPESMSAWSNEIDMARVAVGPIREIAGLLASSGDNR